MKMLYITIIDKDDQYAEALAKALTELCQGLSVRVAHPGEAITPDEGILLAGEDIEDSLTSSMRTLILDGKLRYAGCAAILTKIYDEYAKSGGSGLPLRPDDDLPALLCLDSACHEADVSALCHALSYELSLQGERVILLSRRVYPLSIVIGEELSLPGDMKCVSADYYLYNFMKTNEVKLAQLHTLMAKEISARPICFTYPAGKNPLLELGDEDFLRLALTLAGECDADLVIVDGDICAGLYETCLTRIFVDSAQSAGSPHADAIRMLCEDEGVRFIKACLHDNKSHCISGEIRDMQDTILIEKASDPDILEDGSLRIRLSGAYRAGVKALASTIMTEASDV